MKNGTVQSRVKINEGEQYIVNIVPLGQPCFAMGSPVFLAQILRAFFTVSHGSVDMTFFLARSAANEGNCNHHSWDSFRWVVRGSRRNFHRASNLARTLLWPTPWAFWADWQRSDFIIGGQFPSVLPVVHSDCVFAHSALNALKTIAEEVPLPLF